VEACGRGLRRFFEKSTLTVSSNQRDRRACLEWVLALTAAAVSVGLMLWVGRRMWFRDDVFDFLVGREAGSLESWIRPHAGHLQVAAVGLHRFLYATVGLDFWPWYYLPHLVGHAGLSLLLWRTLLRRGSDGGVAFIAFLVVLFLGVSAFLSSIVIGGLIALALLLWVAICLDGEAAPSVRDRVLVAAALLVMIVSSSVGVAGVVACLGAVAVTRGLRRWWWSFLPAVVVYGAWYATRGATAEQGRMDWGNLAAVPGEILRLLGNSTGRLLGFDGWGVAAGAGIGVLLAAGLGWLAWKRRLRRVDLVFFFSFIGYLLMVGLLRGAAGQPVDRARYAYAMILLAVPALVPRLRLPTRWPTGGRVPALVLIGGLLVGVNGWQRVLKTDDFEAWSLKGRVAMEVLGQALQSGEPALGGIGLRHHLGIETAYTLTVSGVRQFLADGWAPAPPEPWPGWEEARPRLRLVPGRSDLAPAVPALAVSEGSEGCVGMEPGNRRRFAVVASGRFHLVGRRGESAPVGLIWRDRFGVFPREVLVAGRMVVAAAAPPAGGARLEVANRGEDRLRVCGVVEG